MTADDQAQHGRTLEACSRNDASAAENDLTFADLAGWAMKHAGAVAAFINVPASSDLFLLSQAAKLTEEVGELHAAILGRLQYQRPDKLFDQAAIASEIADVMICTAVMSQVLKVDVAHALRSKMDTLDARMHTMFA
jgi:NTP pyrophosphatase (non-canonical NTP hydrolase)